MHKTLIHWWRLMIEPSGKGRLQGFGPKRWRVRYAPCRMSPEGGVSHALAYDVACDYAEMWNGVVERVSPKPEPVRRPRSDAELWESDPHNPAN